MSDFNRRWLPLALWAGVLITFAVVALPEAQQPPALNIDKMRHAVAYALLGALAARAVAASWPGRGGVFAMVAAFFVVGALGAGTESVQMFVPGRSADVVDLSADLLGGILGGALYIWAFPVPARHGAL